MDANNETKADHQLPSSTSISMPLVSRLDRLESLMSVLERKGNGREQADSAGSAAAHSSVVTLEKKWMQMELAAKEVQSKGSLLDRVSALEDRLLKLCLEMESKDMPTSRSSSKMQGFSRANDHTNGLSRSCQVPVFMPSRLQNNKLASSSSQPPLQVTSCGEVDKSKHETTLKKQNRKVEDQQTIIIGPKKGKNHHAWLHMKILGC
ncbi:hypothetical protein Dimus_017493 [Dionaea muscipula]